MPERILDGEMIYRDFFLGYFPASYYLHFALYALWGPSLSILQKSIAFSGAVGAGVFYLVCRKLACRPLSAIAAVMFILWGVISFDIPYPRWYTVTLMLFVMYLLCKRIEGSSGGWLFGSGVLTGMCVLFVQNTGVFLLAGIILFLVLEDLLTSRWNEKNGAGHGTGAASGQVWVTLFNTIFFSVIIGGATLMIGLHFSIRYWLLFVGPLVVLFFLFLTAKGRARRNNMFDEKRPLKFLMSLISLLLGFSLPIVIFLIVLWSALGTATVLDSMILPSFRFGKSYFWKFPDLSVSYYPFLLLFFSGIAILSGRKGVKERIPGWLALAYALLVCLSLVPPLAKWYPTLTNRRHESFSIYMYLPVIVSYVSLIGFVPRVLRWNSASRENAKGELFFCLFLSMNIVSFLQLYPQSDHLHLLWMLPPTILLIAYLVGILLERTHSLTLPWRIFAAILAAIPFFLLSLNLAVPMDILFDTASLLQRRGFVLRSYRVIDQERGDVLVESSLAEELSKVDLYLRNHTSPSEKILVLPAEALIYFLSDRGSATRYIYFHPGYLDLEGIDGLAYVIRRLNSEHVRTIVIRDTDEIVFGYRWWNSYPENGPLAEYIRHNYSRTLRIGHYAILEKERGPYER